MSRKYSQANFRHRGLAECLLQQQYHVRVIERAGSLEMKKTGDRLELGTPQVALGMASYAPSDSALSCRNIDGEFNPPFEFLRNICGRETGVLRGLI